MGRVTRAVMESRVDLTDMMPTFLSLKFRKTGAEIVAQVNLENTDIEAALAKVQTEAEAICRNRELVLSEVIEEERRLRTERRDLSSSTYSMKAAEGIRGAGALKELERDMARLNLLVRRIFVLNDRMEDFKRIVNNIDQTAMFTMGFQELTELGFE